MMPSNLEITGTVRDRFIQASTLLYHLDPVRGEPTSYGLDQNAPDLQAPKQQSLKRKFLDSFALICATKQDGNSVSAACLEEGQPEGTVIRIASNAGVSEDTLRQLKEILSLLNSISNEVCDGPSRELEVLAKIIKLDKFKIRKYLRNIGKSKPAFEESISSLESRLLAATSESGSLAVQQFLDWFKMIYSIPKLSAEPGLGVLQGYVRWATKAKKVYHNVLTRAFSKGDQPLPRWVHTIFKLGRYGIAAKALVRIASVIPALFNPIFVEPVTAPFITQLTIGTEATPLSSVLKRLSGIKPEEMIPRLTAIWNTDEEEDAESFFRRSCPIDLVAHAEVQLVNFYDHNTKRMPRFQFIGVSKKSCYLCSVFLAAHPGSFFVSSSHQKIYPSWILAPALDAKIYKQYKLMTTDMSKKMEIIARHELIRRVDRRFPMPADSTAGVSITGLTESQSVEFTDFEEHDDSYVDLGIETDAGQSDSTSRARPANSHSLYHSEDLSPQVNSSPGGSVREVDLSGRQFTWPDSRVSVSSMVFRFKYRSDRRRQDIVMIGSILDPRTQIPSWSNLVELLNQDDGLGITFRDSDFLIVNEDIQVRNERQFIACLQYLLNSGVLNSEVMICDGRQAELAA